MNICACKDEKNITRLRVTFRVSALNFPFVLNILLWYIGKEYRTLKRLPLTLLRRAPLWEASKSISMSNLLMRYLTYNVLQIIDVEQMFP